MGFAGWRKKGSMGPQISVTKGYSGLCFSDPSGTGQGDKVVTYYHTTTSSSDPAARIIVQLVQ